jgi:hypothetical protein
MNQQDIDYAELLFKHGDIVKSHIYTITEISKELDYYPSYGIETTELDVFDECLEYVKKYKLSKQNNLTYVAERKVGDDMFSVLVYHKRQKGIENG